MEYMEIINHPSFKEACYAVHVAEKILMDDLKMTLEEARKWIHAWASTAGDGCE